MVYASVPPYLDPPNWNQQPPQQSTVTVQSQGLQAGGIGGFGVGGMGEASLQLPQTVSAMPPRSDGGNAGVVRPSSMAERARMAKVPQPEPALKCPRCDSTNTKFCYFNNYSLSQPRHFCKTCRRYWTRGGALRNVPVGGGCRRNKRSKSSSSKALAAERPPGTSTSMALSASGMGVSSIMPSISPPPQMPFMGSFYNLSDYGNPSMGMSYGGVQTIDPGHFQVGSSSAGITALEQWRLQQTQQFPFFTGVEQPSPVPSSLGLYNFDNEGAVDTTPFAEQVHAKPSASGLISQLAPVKMEESSQDQVNLRRQYLGINSSNDHYWHTAAGGSGTGGSGDSTGGGVGWTDLSGTFSSSSTGNLL